MKLQSLKQLKVKFNKSWLQSNVLGLQAAFWFFPEIVIEALFILVKAAFLIIDALLRITLWIPVYLLLGLSGFLSAKSMDETL